MQFHFSKYRIAAIIMILAGAVLAVPTVSEADYTPVKPYSTHGLPNAYNAAAGYGTAHKYGVYGKNDRVQKFNMPNLSR